MSEENEFWTKEAIYDEQIHPLMSKIIAICKEHQIPMVAQFQYENDEENGPGFCTTSLPLPNACDHIRNIARHLKPAGPIALAEIHETMADGSKRITISRVT